jgi:hypothetical protein
VLIKHMLISSTGQSSLIRCCALVLGWVMGCSSSPRDFGTGSGQAGSAGFSSDDASSGAPSSSGGSTSELPSDAGAPSSAEAGAAGIGEVGTTPACDTNSRCVPDAPSGWDGPFSTDLSGTSPNCPKEYPSLIARGGDVPTSSPATCGSCLCSNCQGGTCWASIDVYTSGGPGSGICMGQSTVVTLSSATCSLMSDAAIDSVKFEGIVTDASSVTCTQNAGSVTKAPPQWQTSARLCGGYEAQVGQCENAVYSGIGRARASLYLPARHSFLSGGLPPTTARILHV